MGNDQCGASRARDSGHAEGAPPHRFNEVRAHQGRRYVNVEDTRRAVQKVALGIADGTAGPDSISLAAKLEKMTGVTVSELAVLAEDWPDA